MKNILKKNLNRLVARDFWKVKIWPYFHNPYELQFLFVFQIFCPKSFFLIKIRWSIILLTLWVFFLSLPNLKMISITLNANFHIDSRRFVSDWTYISQRL